MKIPEKGKKAQLILFYNKTKGGVDTVDTQDFWNDAFWTHKTKVEIFWVMHSTTQIKHSISAQTSVLNYQSGGGTEQIPANFNELKQLCKEEWDHYSKDMKLSHTENENLFLVIAAKCTQATKS